MCKATEQDCMDFWAGVLSEMDAFAQYEGIISDGRYIIAEDSENRVVILDEPNFKSAGDKFCDLAGWDVPF